MLTSIVDQYFVDQNMLTSIFLNGNYAHILLSDILHHFLSDL